MLTKILYKLCQMYLGVVKGSNWVLMLSSAQCREEGSNYHKKGN